MLTLFTVLNKIIQYFDLISICAQSFPYLYSHRVVLFKLLPYPDFLFLFAYLLLMKLDLLQ